MQPRQSRKRGRAKARKGKLKFSVSVLPRFRDSDWVRAHLNRGARAAWISRTRFRQTWVEVRRNQEMAQLASNTVSAAKSTQLAACATQTRGTHHTALA